MEQRTALHDRHLGRGARMEWAGPWKRPASYGDVAAEYWAVRRGVGIMDVGTLGKYRICGPDATEFLDRLYPVDVRALRVGKNRYGLLLNEAGSIFDDGIIAALGPNDYFVSVTSGGADAAEAWMRDWAETWEMRVHIINQTAALGAINVAGPRSRDLLTPLTRDAIDSVAVPYAGNRQIAVAGIPCIALRVGFTGELSFELHHPRPHVIALLAGAGARRDASASGTWRWSSGRTSDPAARAATRRSCAPTTRRRRRSSSSTPAASCMPDCRASCTTICYARRADCCGSPTPSISCRRSSSGRCKTNCLAWIRYS